MDKLLIIKFCVLEKIFILCKDNIELIYIKSNIYSESQNRE